MRVPSSRRAGAAVAVALGLWVTALAPVAWGEGAAPDTSAPDTAGPATSAADGPVAAIAPLDVATPAERGPAIQVTDTQPPPPTTAALPPGPAGYDTEEIPPGSGSGRRVIYSKGIQRVWIVDDGELLVRTYRVSGRMSQPNPGTYTVFSRSAFTCAMQRPDICMRWMVRFTRTAGGDNIGFHEIPLEDGRYPLQSDAQLGQPLSGGCIRQATADAQFMWDWAHVGTVVVVLP